ncbi:MAG: diacylglycerol kinase family lipid kinase [Saprospiraceae bacterium]|nr:diacylglycerol kinase family lipid kinase [Saprospiraceae bacterium]
MQSSHPYIKNELLEALHEPTRIVFIVNPKAGTNLQKNIVTTVEKHLNHRRFIYGIWPTEGPGHGYKLAQKAIAEGYEIVVAVGGDGSINEIASALINTKVALGIVPAGSGNGLAMHLGYGREISRAVKLLNSAEVRLMDVGYMNDRPFFNVAGIGFDGLVSNMMKNSGKRGFLPYFLKSVEAGLTYNAVDCTIYVDDQIMEERCFAIAIANGPMYGYNVQIAPDAKIDDGLFEVVLLKDAPRWQYFAAVPATLNGKIYEASFVRHFTAKSIKVVANQPLFVHVDGEGIELNEPLEFTIKPKALHLLAPASLS